MKRLLELRRLYLVGLTILIGIVPSLSQASASTLIGFSWNKSASQEELVSVDPNTGTTTILSTIPGFDYFYLPGGGAIDNSAQRLYQLGVTDTGSSNIYKIFTIDTATGQTLSAQALDRNVDFLYLTADSRLIGLSWNNDNSQEELVSVDPNTGTTTVLSSIPGLDYISAISNGGAIDNSAQRLYQLGITGSGSNSIYKIFTIDTVSGQTLSAQALERKVSYLYLTGDNRLIGLTWNNDILQEELVLIDPSTGAATTLSVIPGFEYLYGGGSGAIDNSAQRLYQLGITGSGSNSIYKIFTIDTESGQEISAQPLDRIVDYLYLSTTTLTPCSFNFDEIGDKTDSNCNGIGTAAYPEIITTTAGDGSRAYEGDGGTATAAALAHPNGVAVDAKGNVYIADTENQRIRRVDSKGVITSIAGTGIAGNAGIDGDQASWTELNYPRGLTVDAAGNLYVANTRANQIRKIDTRGILTLVAGTTAYGFQGDGGPAVSASLAHPNGVAVDTSGNVYIADTENQRIRKVDTTGTITTIAGTGVKGFSGDNGPATKATFRAPVDLSLDAAGNLYVVDSENQRIRKIDTRGIITTVAGIGLPGFGGDNGPATKAKLTLPQGVAVDIKGNLYIADSGNQRIRKVDTKGIITTVAGNGTKGYSGDNSTATAAMLNTPVSLSIDSKGYLSIADMGNNRVRMIVP